MNSDHSPEQKREIAQKILLYSRRYITQKCPILLVPIYALREEVSPIPGPMATDGIHLWYDPEQVIQDFRADRQSPARQLLHITIHCLMGHLKARPLQDDLAVFDAAADWKTVQLIDKLVCGLVSAPCLYCYYNDTSLARVVQRGKTDQEFWNELKKISQKQYVKLDDHSRWQIPPAEEQSCGGQSRTGQKAGAADEAEGGGASAMPDWEGMQKKLADQVQQGSDWGDMAGLMELEMAPAEENGISYEKFLRQFAAPNERLLLDPDSFDPRWYYLGLEQYGDIPLLEPSELSELPVPDDLVIALDTSGSCSGEVCRRFLRETLSLLRDITAGAASFRVLMLQCDTRIQKEVLLEGSDQIEDFLKDFTPSGFGGTDFRPVFQRVAQRQAEGIMPRVKGLLYLSDGYGDFPDQDPGYPVTFLLLEEVELSWYTPELPPWVNALYLNQTDFTLKEASNT